MNNRRRLLFLGGALALVPQVTGAQAKPLRVGWLSIDSAASASVFYDAFREGLKDLGYEEGRNVVLTSHWGDGGSPDRLRDLAADLAKSSNIIVAHGGRAIHAAKAVTSTTPIVFSASGDPVLSGAVTTLARPGGNLTGITLLSLELVGKRMEFLKEAVPSLKRVAIIANPEHAGQDAELAASQSAAKRLGVTVDYFAARNLGELDNAFNGVAKARSEAIVAFPDSTLIGMSDRFAHFSIKNRIPAISGWSQFAERGNVFSYGPHLRDSFRRLAVFVDKIVKGAKPAETPVELPTTVELVVNMKTAKSVGVTIPQAVLVRADKVIE